MVSFGDEISTVEYKITDLHKVTCILDPEFDLRQAFVIINAEYEPFHTTMSSEKLLS